MKKNEKLIIVLVIFAAVFIGLVILIIWNNNKLVEIQREAKETAGETDKSLNKDNCLGEQCLRVEDLEYPAGSLPEEVEGALNDAIQDEYKAHSTYEKVIGKFGSARPFSMIIRAEEKHISSLKALFDKYGLEIPENEWPGKIKAPGSLQEACRIGVEAEIANVKLYKDELIPIVEDYADIRTVFENLMNASNNNHLPAFEKCD